MGVLRRLFGGGGSSGGESRETAEDVVAGTPADIVAEEQAREGALLRADAERLDDPLIQRQLRFADRAWTPPAQGGERRADDGDAEAGAPRD